MFSLLSILLGPTPQKLDLAGLLRSDSCFEMRQADEEGQLPDGSKGEVYRGYLASRFNRPTEASAHLRKYVSDPANGENETLSFAYELLVEADERLEDFKASQTEAREALARLGDYLGPKRTQELIDSQKRDKILEAIPPQTADIVPFQVAMNKDMAGLNRVPVTFGSKEIKTVFDTGAQLSVMSRSTADACGVHLLEGTIPVDAVTGGKVPAQLAEVSAVKFGASTFQHVVVLVMEDSALTFGTYKISAILGFPVIEALGRVEFGQDGTLHAGYPSTSVPRKNLALKGLGPIVRGSYRDTPLTFTIDTDAGKSHFTKRFLDRFPDLSSSEVGVMQLGGAGGNRDFKIYIVPQMDLLLGGQSVGLTKVSVLTESSSDDIDRYSGNFGQDVFRQFSTMVLDFRQMSFELQNK